MADNYIAFMPNTLYNTLNNTLINNSKKPGGKIWLKNF